MSEIDSAVDILPRTKSRPMLVDLIIRVVKEKPLGTFGGIIVLAMLVTGIFADFIAPYGMLDMDFAHMLAPPSAEHLLGTDNLGRDVLSRIIYGARISMIVSVGGSALSATLAITVGIASGFFGGKLDIIVQRIVDAWMSFPWIFIVLTIISLIGPGMVQVIIVLALAYGIRDSRVIRSAVIRIKEDVYMQASVAIGCSNFGIIRRHVLPNIMAPVIILFTITMGYMILAEATMSFLGYGIPPPQPSWGGMLSLEGRQFMEMAPTLALWPGLALALVVFGANMLGDAVRDVLDPRLRGGIGRYGGVKTKKAVKKQ
jgi:peptide/nickel transport system permease protein